MPRGRPRKNPDAAPVPKKTTRAKAKTTAASLGFEQQMFLAADKLRKNLEPSDYKHVTLGLIFLRYVSPRRLKPIMPFCSMMIRPHLKPLPRHIQKSNAGKSVIRSRVEYVFADQKSQMELFIRIVSITRATMRIGLANIVYNMRRFLCLERVSASA